MKRRIDIFETNSSSSHSISFNPWKSGKDGNTFVPDENGNIYIQGGEFGWDWNSFNDSETKANYYLERYKDQPERIELLKKVVEEYTGANVIISEDTDGYIDHQSFDTLDLPYGNSEALKDWLFNPDNWLYTGNDNDDEPQDLRDPEWSGLDGDHVVVTIEFGTDDMIEVKIIGMPNEENLGPKLNSLSLSDGYYDLSLMDLEKNFILLREDWSGREKAGKIIKIKSDEFGEIIP
jgi:hypothetical protein